MYVCMYVCVYIYISYYIILYYTILYCIVLYCIIYTYIQRVGSCDDWIACDPSKMHPGRTQKLSTHTRPSKNRKTCLTPKKSKLGFASHNNLTTQCGDLAVPRGLLVFLLSTALVVVVVAVVVVVVEVVAGRLQGLGHGVEASRLQCLGFRVDSHSLCRIGATTSRNTAWAKMLTV